MASIPAWACLCDECKRNRANQGRLSSGEITNMMERIKGYNATIEFQVSPSTTAFFQGYFNKSEEKPMSTTTPRVEQAIAKDIEALPCGADLSAVKAAVERAEKEQRARIMKAVESQADLCHMAGPKTKRFVVAYWLGKDIIKTAEGLEYPVEIGDKDEIVGNNVILNDYRHPFFGVYKSMEAFRERLTSMNLPHSVAYFDKQ